MRKSQKQLLGLTGLAAVGLLTAIAYNLPASAAESQDVKVNVTIYERNLSATITYPQSGSTVVNSDLTFQSTYAFASELEYFLDFKGLDGSIKSHSWKVTNLPAENGTHSELIDLAAVGYGYGEYTLRMVTRGAAGNTIEDTVSFNYGAVAASNAGADTVGNPIVDLETAPDTVTMGVQVYDADGKPQFVNADGQEVPFIVNKSDVDPDTGKLLATFPMDKYNLPGGAYTAVITAYNQDGDRLTAFTYPFEYKPVVKVPDTGALSNLNVTRLDYLLTGLIAFGSVSAFAFFLIAKKSRRA